jgi:hypothetical protein
MNELYNTIINNYVDESPVNLQNLVDLKEILIEEVKNITQDQVRGIIDRVARNSIKELKLDNPTKTVSISIKPTTISEEGFKTLYQICNIDHFSSMTKAIRNLLISYTKLTVIEREKIICKKAIADLQYAIKNHLQVSITHSGKDYIIDPYIFITPIDDFSNYLIAKDQDGKYRLLRIIKIKVNKVIEYSTYSITKSVSEVLKKYMLDGVKVFDSKLTDTLKKILNQDDVNEVFPNVVNQLRGLSGDEHELQIKSNNWL